MFCSDQIEAHDGTLSQIVLLCHFSALLSIALILLLLFTVRTGNRDSISAPDCHSVSLLSQRKDITGSNQPFAPPLSSLCPLFFMDRSPKMLRYLHTDCLIHILAANITCSSFTGFGEWGEFRDSLIMSVIMWCPVNISTVLLVFQIKEIVENIKTEVISLFFTH